MLSNNVLVFDRIDNPVAIKRSYDKQVVPFRVFWTREMIARFLAGGFIVGLWIFNGFYSTY